MSLTNQLGLTASTLGNLILGPPARTEHGQPQSAVDPLTAGVALTMTAANPLTGDAIPLTSGHALILAVNADSADHSFIVSSALDSFNRHGDITDTIAAGTLRLFGPFAPDGWSQAFRSQLWLWAESALVSFAVVEVA